ncbi:hypothetical protein HDU76_011002 [Blyttiomyces sp. JEL0837]|nr:hypothetical protein HDU76_011002 [Blyttiomyces sp. JEL0837]
MDPIPDVTFLQGDMTDSSVQAKAIELSGGLADVVVSDMAHSFTGNRGADVARVMDLCNIALSVAKKVLKPRGSFVCKFLRGDGEAVLKDLLLTNFSNVYFDKPQASRGESAEAYFICTGYMTNPTRRKQPISHTQVKTSRHEPPHWMDITPGTKVLVSLPKTTILAEGIVETVLSRDYHAKGVRVRLTDGRVGRATDLVRTVEE